MSERCILLMRRARDRRVLVVGDPPRLPSVAAPSIWFPAAVAGVATAASRLVAGPVQVLRLVLDDEVRLWELESLGSGVEAPRDQRWVPPGELTRLPTHGARHAEALGGWVGELERPTSADSRAPWQRVGWLRGVREWVRKQDPGLLPAEDLSTLPVRGAWPASCVLQVRGRRSSRYFKATPTSSVAESSLIGALSGTWGSSLPEVLAEDPRRRWMLMRALPRRGSEAIEWSDLAGVLGLLARIQIDTVTRLGAAPFRSLPEWRLDALGRDLALTVEGAGRRGLLRDSPGAPDGARALARLPERVDDTARRLGRMEVPYALVHTDFHPGNIARRRGRPVILDWAEAARGHPFFAATRLFDYLEFKRGRDERRAQLVEAYLRPWRRRLPAGGGEDAFELALRLHPVRQAIRWHRVLEATPSDAAWTRVVEGALSRELSRCTRLGSRSRRP